MDCLECPNCNERMSFLSFAKAPTPWNMKCHKCDTKLKQSKYKGASLLVAIIFGLVLGMSTAILAIHYGHSVLGLIVFVTGLLAFEYAGFKVLPKLGVGLVQKNA